MAHNPAPQISAVIAATRARRLVWLAGAAALGLAGVSGCGEGDATSQSIESGMHQSALLPPASESLTSQEMANATYQSILSDSGLTSSDTTAARQEAAAMVLASARRGQSVGDVRRLVRSETQSQQQMMIIRAEVNAWSALQAQASGVESYDNSAILSDLDRLEDDVNEQLQAAEDRLADLDRDLAALQTRYDRLSGRAREERGRAGEIFLRLASLEPNERILQSSVAEEHARTAANFERDADEVKLRIEQLEPRINEVQVRESEFKTQLGKIDAARETSNARVAAKRRGALQARADAALAAERMGEMIRDLLAQRDGTLAEHRSAAIRGFDQALSSARKAPRSSSTRPSTQQAAGHLHAAIARGYAAELELLEALVSVTPALPDAATYRSRIDQVRRAHQEAIQSAADAFSEAANGYGSVRLTGDDADKIDSLQESLEALSATLLGEQAKPDAQSDNGNGAEDDMINDAQDAGGYSTDG